MLMTCFGRMPGQVWANLIDSMPNSSHLFRSYAIDPTSNTLYIGGLFHQINQHRTKGIIKFNGSTFDTLGSGLDNHLLYNSLSEARSLAWFQNKLYVGGYFAKTGKYYCGGLGRWNGTSWDTVDFKPNAYVNHLKVFNNELYLAGGFTKIGGVTTNNIAKFDGTTWTSLSYSFATTVSDIEMFNGKLYFAGQTTPSSSDNLSVYNGTSWTGWVGVTGNTSKGIFGMKTIDNMLYVYGRFTDIAGTNCSGLAAFDGTMWHGFGTGVQPTSYAYINDVTKINGELYVSGIFDNIDGVASYGGANNSITNFAKFDGQKWCAVSPPFNNLVYMSLEYKGDMYAAGAFDSIGYNKNLCLAKWIGGNSTISCGSPIGINEISNGISNVRVFPNPCSKELTIEADLNECEIQIYNVLGQRVYSCKSSNKINVENFANGCYDLQIISNHGTSFHSKFIKE